eukprot:m.88122 g.88122  ORF g.88122 m.88122 type:complete len:333 (-) comp15166_c0_seq1:22-1020(-)
MTNIANCEWKRGCLPQAKLVFEECQKLDSLCLEYADIHAHVLVAQGAELELSALSTHLINVSKKRAEPWLAVARYCQLLCESSSDDRATRFHARRGLKFAARAEMVSTTHAEVYMVKGTLLLSLNKSTEAGACFQRALELSREFSAHQGLVSCFLAAKRNKEALLKAKFALSCMPNNPRAITLLGVACARCESGTKARRAFENALTIDPNCMDAVFALVELDIEEHKYDAAIDLLKKHLHNSRADYMHRRLGEVYYTLQNYEQSLEQHLAALKINPEYLPAKIGAERATNRLNGVPDAEEPDEGELDEEDLNIGDDVLTEEDEAEEEEMDDE